MNDYPTIQYVPVAAILPEFEKIMRRLNEIEQTIKTRNETELTNKQIADLLNVTPRTVYNLKSAGKIGIIKKGIRIVRFCDVEDYKKAILEGNV